MPHSKIISGIDLGTSKITIIIGQYLNGDEHFNIVAVASIPALGFRRGQIINLEQATQTITQSIESAERMAGFQIHDASICLSAPHIESLNSPGVVAISNQNGEINDTDIDRVIDAAKAVSIPAGKEIIHVIPRKFTVDGQDGVIDPIGMNGTRLEVESHLILASNPAIKNLRKCFEGIKININSIIYSGLAAAKACLTETEKELGVTLVDIGGSVTTITIFIEGSPIYSSVIPIGANNITNDLAIGLRLPIEDAEKIKLKLGKISENKKYEDEIEVSHFGILENDKRKISLQTAINGIIKPRLEEIFNVIYNQIISSGLDHSIPAGIVLTGGGAETVNVKDICNQVIPLPFRIASPPKVGGIVDDILNPSYTSSVGLLMLDQTENASRNPAKRNKHSGIGIIARIKSFIEPLLP